MKILARSRDIPFRGVFLPLWFGLIFCGAWAAPQKITVDYVNGEVSFQRGKRDPKPVKKTTRLKTNDRIKTGPESSLELRLETGSIIRLEENSELHIQNLEKAGVETRSTLALSVGKMAFNVKKLTSKKSDFQFETPTAVAAIRGTEGGIGTNGQKTFAYLSEGALLLDPKNGGGKITIQELEVAVQTPLGFDVNQVKNKEELVKRVATVEKKFSEEAATLKAMPKGNVPSTRQEKKQSHISISGEDGSNESQTQPSPESKPTTPLENLPTPEDLERFKEELNAPNELEESDLLEIPQEEILDKLPSTPEPRRQK